MGPRKLPDCGSSACLSRETPDREDLTHAVEAVLNSGDPKDYGLACSDAPCPLILCNVCADKISMAGTCVFCDGKCIDACHKDGDELVCELCIQSILDDDDIEIPSELRAYLGSPSRERLAASAFPHAEAFAAMVVRTKAVDATRKQDMDRYEADQSAAKRRFAELGIDAGVAKRLVHAIPVNQAYDSVSDVLSACLDEME